MEDISQTGEKPSLRRDGIFKKHPRSGAKFLGTSSADHRVHRYDVRKKQGPSNVSLKYSILRLDYGLLERPQLILVEGLRLRVRWRADAHHYQKNDRSCTPVSVY